MPIDAARLAGYDCVRLATEHDVFDYDLIRAHAALVVDTRGRFGRRTANVVSA